ncbi:MAG TPA: hypothetical protein PK413_16080, partial [Thermoanaerobaculia bacterium]|nr:hypothetical protein [Thermoanaerobaculia bacterium]
MSQHQELDFERWQQDWKAATSAQPRLDARALRSRVRRRTFWLAIGVAFEEICMAFAVWNITGLALAQASRVDRWLLLGVVGSLLWAMGFALWIQRGTWRASTESTQAFIDLARLRCRRVISSVPPMIAYTVVLVGIYLVTGWRQAVEAGGGQPDPATLLRNYGFLAGVVAAVWGFAGWYIHRTRQELAELDRLAAGLGEED